jgi:hypothetical protein
MSEWLDQAHNLAMPPPKCMSASDRTDSHLKKDTGSEATTEILPDVSNFRAPGPRLSEQEVQQVHTKDGEMIQYIHFTLNKNGCLE